MRESGIERAFREWCKDCGHLCLKMEGVSRGFPDRLVVLATGEVLFMEFKTPRGRLSLHQKYWITELESRGHFVGVPRSAESAIRMIEEHLSSVNT